MRALFVRESCITCIVPPERWRSQEQAQGPVCAFVIHIMRSVNVMARDPRAAPGVLSGLRPETGSDDTRMQRPDAASVDGPGLDVELRGHLGGQLRAFFQEIVNEPLPARFSQLLDELTRKGVPDGERR